MDNYLGEIRLFAGLYSPSGWMFCNGQLLNIAEYTALYQLLGTIYGGDGVSTFALPNLQGRVPVGQGTGDGLTNRTMGELGGTETVTLTQNQIPPHSHQAAVTNGNASTQSPSATVVYGTVTPNGDTYSLYTALNQPDVKPHQMGINAVGAAGNSQPHDNTMVTTTINYIIALNGIYPTQN